MKCFLFGVAFVIAFYATVINASPYFLTPNGNASIARPCSHFGMSMGAVGSTGSTGNRSAAISTGSQVMVTCDVDTHMLQGPSSVTGNTTTGTILWDHVPYWFVSEPGGQYFAFTKKSGESDGTCYVTECR